MKKQPLNIFIFGSTNLYKQYSYPPAIRFPHYQSIHLVTMDFSPWLLLFRWAFMTYDLSETIFFTAAQNVSSVHAWSTNHPTDWPTLTHQLPRSSWSLKSSTGNWVSAAWSKWTWGNDGATALRSPSLFALNRCSSVHQQADHCVDRLQKVLGSELNYEGIKL